MPLSTGFRLGPFEIVSAIGAGGMGEVYRARDSKLGRDVAIKVLPETFAGDPDRMARFGREAKLLAALDHSNIASIYGLEDSGSTHALVMQLAEGPTLADRIAQGPIPIEDVLRIAKQICEALEYAHEKGIIHRDLKPANVKVANDDTVKILDFGLAKALESSPSATNIANSPTLSHMATQAGMLLGTAAYMSPEQAKGKSVDRRADIWALGCVLYEMLTGKKAFPGEVVTDTLAAVLTKDPDLSQLPAATPMRVRVLLQRCLQKDPKQRLRDIGDARISLEEVLSGSPEAELAAAPEAAISKWRRALPWAAVAIFATIAVLFGIGYFMRAPKEPPAAPAQVLRYEVFPPEKASFGNGLALSPNGRHLAFTVTTQGGQTQLWVRDLDTLKSRPLAGTDGGAHPFWSPNSRLIGFAVDSVLETVDISGGAPQKVCDLPGVPLGVSWSRDGVIVFGTYAGLMKVPATGGKPSLLTKVDPARGEVEHVPLSFLPDGRHFLYGRSPGPDEGTYVGSLDQGPEQQNTERLLPAPARYAPALGAGPGYLLVGKNGTLIAQRFDSSKMQLKGDAIPLAQQVNSVGVSSNGIVAYTNLANQDQLTWYDQQGKVVGTLGEPGVTGFATISPDGRRVAVGRAAAEGKIDLWVYNVATGAPTRLTFDGKTNDYAVWSPDGSYIAFVSGRGGALTVYEMAVNGIGQIQALDKQPANFRVPIDWSHDGRYLIEGVLVDAKSKYSVWVLPLAPGQAGPAQKSYPYLSGAFNYVAATLSPNGRWLAYASDETGRYEVYVQTFPKPGGKWSVSTNGGMAPAWSHDGKELYFLGGDGRLMSADVKSGPDGSFEASAPKALFQTYVDNPLTRFEVSKDGRFLFFRPAGQSGAPITVVVNWPSLLKK